MPVIIHGSKGDISAWSGSLIEKTCQKCNSKFLEFVKFAKFKTLYGQKMYKQKEMIGLKCIYPSCDAEYIFNETVPNFQVSYKTITDSEKLKKYKEDRKAAYVSSVKEIKSRHKFVNAYFNQLPNEPDEFEVKVPLTEDEMNMEALKSIPMAFGIMSIGWAFIMFALMIISGIFFSIFASFFFEDLLKSPIVYLIILVISFFWGWMYNNTLHDENPRRAVSVNSDKLRLILKVYDTAPMKLPYLVVSPDFRNLTIYSLGGEELEVYSATSLKITDQQFFTFVTALNNLGFVSIHDWQKNQLDVYLIPPKNSDDQLFVMSYSNKISRLLKKL